MNQCQVWVECTVSQYKKQNIQNANNIENNKNKDFRNSRGIIMGILVLCRILFARAVQAAAADQSMPYDYPAPPAAAYNQYILQNPGV